MKSNLIELQNQVNQAKGLSITEAAKVLEIHRTTMYTYIREGKLKTFYFNGKPRIAYQEIQNFINQAPI